MIIKKNKIKKIIIILVGIAIILLGILFLLQKGNNYPEEGEIETNLGTTQTALDVSEISDNWSNKVPLYTINKESGRENVEKIINEMSYTLTATFPGVSGNVVWSEGDTEFKYNSAEGILTFNLEQGLKLEEGEAGFSSFFREYLDLDYDFEISSQLEFNSGEIVYNADRLLKGVPVERGVVYDYTDSLRYNKEGLLIGGTLLVVTLEQSNESIPLISRNELTKYINFEEYPKERYIDISSLMDTINIPYVDPRWSEIEQSAANCEASSCELIFLIKGTTQKYLFPTLKIDAECEVSLKLEVYPVSGTFLVSAVKPEYVASE